MVTKEDFNYVEGLLKAVPLTVNVIFPIQKNKDLI